VVAPSAPAFRSPTHRPTTQVTRLVARAPPCTDTCESARTARRTSRSRAVAAYRPSTTSPTPSTSAAARR